MRLRIVLTIARKELVDTLRDRRALFAMFVLPTLLYPLLFLVLAQLTASAEAAREAERPQAVVLGDLPEPARAALARAFGETLEARPRPSPSLEAVAQAARALVETGHADLVLAANPDATARFAADEGVTIDAWFDDVRPRSQTAHERADEALAEASRRERDARLARRHLPPAFDRPLSLAPHDAASKARRGGAAAGRLLPFVLVFVMVVAGLLPAVDLTAGEKERGTMQTLLTAPLTPLEIVAGKYVAVVAMSLTGAAANLLAMAATLGYQVSQLARGAGAGAGAIEFHLGLGAALAIFVAMVPCALLFAALLLALAVLARSFREANAYLSPVLLVLTLPAMVAMLPTVELDATTALAPVVNLALLLRALLEQRVAPGLYAIVFVANALYATLAVLLAARIFETEQVLLGGERPLGGLFDVPRSGSRSPPRTPTVRQAVLFVVVLIVANYYGSLALLARGVNGIAALAIAQAGLLLAPALLFVRLSRLDARATLLLALPRARGLAGAVFLASGAWAVGGLFERAEAALFPGARAYYALFERALGDLHAGAAAAVLVVAVLPAIAEEACFRGVVLTGLGGSGSRAVALVGSAALFGLFHVNPYHALGAFVLGLLFGAAALASGSLLPSILAHLANNALALALLRAPSLSGALSRPAVVSAGVASAALGLALLRGSRRAGIARE